MSGGCSEGQFEEDIERMGADKLAKRADGQKVEGKRR